MPEGDPAAHCDFSDGLITQNSEKCFEERPNANVTGALSTRHLVSVLCKSNNNILIEFL